MPLDSFNRGSGEWEQDPKSRRALKILLQRSWLLVVPLIALAWYNTRVLTPQAEKLDEEITKTRAEAEQQRTKTLSEARRIQIGMSMLAALSDTFQVRFTEIDAVIDSVTTLKQAELNDLAWMKSRADSLRKLYSSNEGRWRDAAVLLPPLQSRIDSLAKVVVGREEQLTNLEAEIRAATDSADRVLRPDLYRKNTALLTGPGEFPNRDALPKR